MSQPDTAKFCSPEYTRSRLQFPSITPRRQLGLPSSSQPFSSLKGCLSSRLTLLDAALSLPSRSTAQPYSPLAARWSQTQTQTQTQTQMQTETQAQGDDEDADGPSSSVGACAVAGGGIRRGEVTEVMGPRGAGKTAFAMGVAATALVAGEKVMWIDTSGPVCLDRFRDILREEIRRKKRSSLDEFTPLAEGVRKSVRETIDDALKRLLYFHAPTLAHLMALISNPPPGFPPQDTGLIVIDNISTLFSTEFKPFLPSKRASTVSAPTPISRRRLDSMEKQDKLRWKLIGSLLSSLRKLALRLDSAVLTVNEMGSRFRSGRRPMLHQALSGVTWDLGVSTRIVLYFAWLPPQHRAQIRFGGMTRVRIAEVLKTGGNSHVVRSSKRVVPFLLVKGGVCDVPAELGLSVRLPRRSETMQTRLLKRKMVTHATSSPVRQRARTEDRDEVEISTDQDHGVAAFQHVPDGNDDGPDNGVEEEDAQDGPGENTTTSTTTGTTKAADISKVTTTSIAADDGPLDAEMDAELLLANIPDEEDFT